jgi:hypothetical protein
MEILPLFFPDPDSAQLLKLARFGATAHKNLAELRASIFRESRVAFYKDNMRNTCRPSATA